MYVLLLKTHGLNIVGSPYCKLIIAAPHRAVALVTSQEHRFGPILWVMNGCKGSAYRGKITFLIKVCTSGD